MMQIPHRRGLREDVDDDRGVRHQVRSYLAFLRAVGTDCSNEGSCRNHVPGQESVASGGSGDDHLAQSCGLPEVLHNGNIKASTDPSLPSYKMTTPWMVGSPLRPGLLGKFALNFTATYSRSN